MNASYTSSEIPSEEEISDKVFQLLGFRQCRSQIHTGRESIGGKRVIIYIARTGGDKTTPLIIPSFFEPRAKRVTIIIAPLNILSEQHGKNFEKARVKAAFITAETKSANHWEVCTGSNPRFDASHFFDA